MRVRVWERFTGESGGGSGLPCWDEGEPDVPVGGEEIGIGERKRKTPGGLEPWMRGDVQRPWPELVVVTRFHSVIFVERGTRLFGGWRFLFFLPWQKKDKARRQREKARVLTQKRNLKVTISAFDPLYASTSTISPSPPWLSPSTPVPPSDPNVLTHNEHQGLFIR